MTEKKMKRIIIILIMSIILIIGLYEIDQFLRQSLRL